MLTEPLGLPEPEEDKETELLGSEDKDALLLLLPLLLLPPELQALLLPEWLLEGHRVEDPAGLPLWLLLADAHRVTAQLLLEQPEAEPEADPELLGG